MERSSEIAQALVVRTSVKRLQNSLHLLAANKTFLNNYADLEAFGFLAFEQHEAQAKAIEYHLVQIRRVILQELWKRQLFLSASTVEQLLYFALKSSGSPVQSLVESIFTNGLHHAGFVLYPLHSFGFLAMGLFSLGGLSNSVRIDLRSAGIALTPQTNSLDGSAAFIDSTRKRLRIDHAASVDELEHYYTSRNLRWYTHNPLLAVRVASYTSGYYENQRILLLKLRFSTTLLAMMAVMGRREAPETYQEFSTARVNNWQTLDIRHYLVFQARPRSKELSIDCTPMHLDRTELIELSDLGTDIDPGVWRDAGKRKRLNILRDALAFLEQGYLAHCLIGSKDAAGKRLFEKLANSINYFRRSLRSRSHPHENVIALAIAFETLLIDFYSPGVTGLIRERARKCLKGVRGVTKLNDAVENLFIVRGQVVHTGDTSHSADLWTARQAYVICLLTLTKRLSALSSIPENPISAVLP